LYVNIAAIELIGHRSFNFAERNFCAQVIGQKLLINPDSTFGRNESWARVIESPKSEESVRLKSIRSVGTLKASFFKGGA
jgi:hypothetical protein